MSKYRNLAGRKYEAMHKLERKANRTLAKAEAFQKYIRFERRQAGRKANGPDKVKNNASPPQGVPQAFSKPLTLPGPVAVPPMPVPCIAAVPQAGSKPLTLSGPSSVPASAMTGGPSAMKAVVSCIGDEDPQSVPNSDMKR